MQLPKVMSIMEKQASLKDLSPESLVLIFEKVLNLRFHATETGLQYVALEVHPRVTIRLPQTQ